MTSISSSRKHTSSASSKRHWLVGLTTAAAFLFSQALCAQPDEPGVYLAVGDDYQPLGTVSEVNGLNYDFAPFVLSLPEAPGVETPLEMLVVEEDVNPKWIHIEYRTIESPAAGKRLSPQNHQKLDNGGHRLTLEADTSEPGFLLVDMGCCQDSVYGIALTNTKESMLDIFGDEDMNPVSALHTVKGFLRGAPDDRDLNKLVESLEQREQHAEASRYFERIEQAWGDYESAEKTADKVEALEYVQSMADHYVETYPSGPELRQVKRYQKQANDKLDI